MNDVLVLPEVWTQYLNIVSVRNVIWWLSVDNNGGSFKTFTETAAQGVVHVILFCLNFLGEITTLMEVDDDYQRGTESFDIFFFIFFNLF